MLKPSRLGSACTPPAGAASTPAVSDTPCWHSGLGQCWGASGPRFHWSLPCIEHTGQVTDKTSIQLTNPVVFLLSTSVADKGPVRPDEIFVNVLYVSHKHLVPTVPERHPDSMGPGIADCFKTSIIHTM